jgi:hypothetical protein
MWPYNGDENDWLGQKSAQSVASQTKPLQLTPELMDFYRQRAQELRRNAIANFFGTLTRISADAFRHLGMLSSGNRTKVETAIAELRQQAVKQRNAGTAGR